MVATYQKNIKPFGLTLQDLKNIELDALPVYGDRYVQSKMKIYSDKVYANFGGLDVPEDGAQCFGHILLIYYLFMATNIT